MNETGKIVCFGEILWDVFPDAKVIGGAPLNVALRLQSQGHKVAMISRLGKDRDGEKAYNIITQAGLPTTGIQWDETLSTGKVLVTINEKGSANYVITEPVAWDALTVTEEGKRLVSEASIFVFGSLACRREKSRETLFELLSEAKFSVFDVNLRPPYYSMELLQELMGRSNFVKLNDEELIEITDALGLGENRLKDRAIGLLHALRLEGLCVTKGPHGAFLFWKGEFYDHLGYSVAVKDTVGAGDSFLATLIGELLANHQDPNNALNMACAVGALVASKAGANCVVSESELKMMVPNS